MLDETYILDFVSDPQKVRNDPAPPIPERRGRSVDQHQEGEDETSKNMNVVLHLSRILPVHACKKWNGVIGRLKYEQRSKPILT